MSRVTFPLVINGFTISADYEQEDMEMIFLPLLRKLSEFQKEKNDGFWSFSLHRRL